MRMVSAMNWNQTGMPSALVSRLGQRREIAEFKSVLNDAQNHVLRPVDVEAMAQELVKAGGREFVEMVRELTTALANAEKELEAANRRYERMVADLERRGVSVAGDVQARQDAGELHEDASGDSPPGAAKSSEGGQAEWEEWDRRFRALLG